MTLLANHKFQIDASSSTLNNNVTVAGEEEEDGKPVKVGAVDKVGLEQNAGAVNKTNKHMLP